MSAAKKSKPPIDKKAVRARLERARSDQLLVVVRRWIPGGDAVQGFVVGVGARWVALQRLAEQRTFDGWVLVRLKDIQAVSINPDAGCFEIKALRARRLWPPQAPEVGLDDTVGLLASLPSSLPLVAVFDEFHRPDVCWIGAVASVDEARVRLLEVTTRGEWARRPRSFDPDDVTRLDLGDGYAQALFLVAGPPPGE